MHYESVRKSCHPQNSIKTKADVFKELISPFIEDIVVAVECMFTWYWLADCCSENDIEFVLGHALYMKAIHGGKTKNDKIDSLKIATILRGGMAPKAYVYPKRYFPTPVFRGQSIDWSGIR